ncbi:MAG: hypothetical protein U0T72_06180 [Chitinophagales bacterium]
MMQKSKNIHHCSYKIPSKNAHKLPYCHIVNGRNAETATFNLPQMAEKCNGTHLDK